MLHKPKIPPVAYSWLGSAPEKYKEENLPLSDWERNRLDTDCMTMENALALLENKVHRYQALCKRYEKVAGTVKAPEILKQMDVLKEEIDKISKKLSKTLDEAFRITHHQEK